MSLKKQPVKDEEALRFENELLQAKIAAQYGGMHGSRADTPPEILNAFLKNIIKFEESMQNSKEIPLYDYIGRPEFTKEEELSDEQVSVELEKVNELLYSYDIVCDNIDPVSDRLLYKFLTEELFQQTVSDQPVPGMTTNFIYEEFHPNHECDTARRCKEFIDIFFCSEFHQRIQYYFPDQIRNFAELSAFHEAFEEFKNVNYKVYDADVAPDQCIRKATISFDAITSEGTKPIHYSGEAIFELDYTHECWTVIFAQFPGMIVQG